MSSSSPKSSPAEHVQVVRNGFASALRGDFEALSEVLADDVRWRGAGEDPNSGCTNRREVLGWLGEAISRGVSAEVLDVRRLDENRVLVLLQRAAPQDSDRTAELPPPHGQVVTFRGDKVAEIVVYPSEEEAIRAARNH